MKNDERKGGGRFLWDIAEEIPGLKHLKNLEPILRKAPKLLASLTKVLTRLGIGSPERIKAIAAAQAVAYVAEETAKAGAVVFHAWAERIAKETTAGANPKLVQRALNRYFEEAVRGQPRIDQTIAKALNEIPTLPPGDDASSEIDDDWLSLWGRLAETKSNEDMQELFAKVLAREACRPGSFSPTTLQLLSIMTPYVAKKFETLCRMSFWNGGGAIVILNAPAIEKPTTARNSVGTHYFKGEQLSEYDLDHQDLLMLRAAGLLLSLPEEEYPDLSDYWDADELDYAGRSARLVLDQTVERAVSLKRGTNVLSLTQSGVELRSILVLDPHPKYTSVLRQVLRKAAVRLKIRQKPSSNLQMP